MESEDGIFARLREVLDNGSMRKNDGGGVFQIFSGRAKVAEENHGIINITINHGQVVQRLTYRQRHQIRRLVSHVVKAAAKAGAPVTFPQAYRRLHDEFGVDRYDDIPAASYRQARAFLLGLAAGYDGEKG